MTIPRGIRNSNPLNLRPGGGAWRGLAADQSDSGYLAFQSPEFGIRAAAINLQTYAEKYGVDTLREIVARWAPAGDGNDVLAYISTVSAISGIAADEPLDMWSFEVVGKLLRAMTIQENGRSQNEHTYWYDDATWERGLRLAGLSPAKTIAQSKNAQSHAVAGSAIAAAIGILTGELSVPQPIAELLPSVLAHLDSDTAAVVLLAIGLVPGPIRGLVARFRDYQRGNK